MQPPTWARLESCVPDLRQQRGAGLVLLERQCRYQWHVPKAPICASKRDVKTLDHDDVERLRGVSYVLKENGASSIGVIAQEVEKIFPQLLFTDNKGMKAIDYAKIAAVLVEGLKESNTRQDASLAAPP